MAALQRYPWPGNIRELRNVVERAMIVATGPRLTIGAADAAGVDRRHSLKLVDVQKEHIREVLESAGWRIRGSAARPIAWACGRRRSRRAWPSWDCSARRRR